MRSNHWFPKRLSTQLVIILVSLVILTATMIGLPAIWLINRQIETQFWERIEHGQRASKALLRAEGRDVAGLARLTAQRPTLKNLLLARDLTGLPIYLETLREGVGLDFLVVCGSDMVELGAAGLKAGNETCGMTLPDQYDFIELKPQGSIALLASSPIEEQAETLGVIVVGEFIDDEFALELRDQSGLEHTFLFDDQVIASSLGTGESFESLDAIPVDATELTEGLRFVGQRDGVTYYVVRLEFDGSLLVDDAALSTEALTLTRQRLGGGWLAGMAIVVVLGSIVGLVLSRRIGVTFDRLAAAAVAFQKGDLVTPVQVEADLEEAHSVAQALESARQALNESLLDLRREKEWSDQLLDSIVEGIVILDHAKRITFFSSGAERLSGWARAQALEQPCDDLFQPYEIEQPLTSMLPRLGSKTTLALEMAAGRRSSLAISAAAFKPSGSEQAQTLLLFRDVSEEQAIHRLMGHFMANISHEFRTPLSAIAASTELLMDQVEQLSSTELHELLGALHLGILKLSTLVDNLIESASIETGHFRVSPRPVDLGEVIGEVVETMQPLLDKHQQRLEVELPIAIPTVSADPRRTVQVLTNLLSNAIKFGPPGSVIKILTRAEDGLVRVEVHDRGPGVAQEHQDFIFRRFASLPQDDDPGAYGVGLGLSVVKAIVEAGGGDVGVLPNPDGGAVFWFTLPREQAP